MARPAARRLLDLIKKRRRKALVGKLLPAPLQQRFGTLKKSSKSAQAGGGGGPQILGHDLNSPSSSLSLTCLIQDKDITLQGEIYFEQ